MKNVSGYLAGRSATGLLRPKRVFMLRRPFAVFRIVLHNNSAPLTDNEDVGYQSAILFGAIVLAQLDPTSGVPLSSGSREAAALVRHEPASDRGARYRDL